MKIRLIIFLVLAVFHGVQSQRRLLVNTTCLELAKPSNQQFRLICSQNDYHCLLDETFTKEFEVCREWKWIPGGKCAYFNTYGSGNVDERQCNPGINLTCSESGYQFESKTNTKFTACYAKRRSSKSFTTTTSLTQVTSNMTSDGNTATLSSDSEAWIIFFLYIISIAVVLSISVIYIHIYMGKRLCIKEKFHECVEDPLINYDTGNDNTGKRQVDDQVKAGNKIESEKDSRVSSESYKKELPPTDITGKRQVDDQVKAGNKIKSDKDSEVSSESFKKELPSTDGPQFCNEVQSNADEEGKGGSKNCDDIKERESLTETFHECVEDPLNNYDTGNDNTGKRQVEDQVRAGNNIESDNDSSVSSESLKKELPTTDGPQFCNEVQSNTNEEGKGESENCDDIKERESLTETFHECVEDPLNNYDTDNDNTGKRQVEDQVRAGNNIETDNDSSVSSESLKKELSTTDGPQFCNEVHSNANEEGKGRSGNCDDMKERESLKDENDLKDDQEKPADDSTSGSYHNQKQFEDEEEKKEESTDIFDDTFESLQQTLEIPDVIERKPYEELYSLLGREGLKLSQEVMAAIITRKTGKSMKTLIDHDKNKLRRVLSEEILRILESEEEYATSFYVSYGLHQIYLDEAQSPKSGWGNPIKGKDVGIGDDVERLNRIQTIYSKIINSVNISVENYIRLLDNMVPALTRLDHDAKFKQQLKALDKEITCFKKTYIT